MAMSKGRSASVMVNLEPEIHAILLDFVRKQNMSASGYVRRLIINDLRRGDEDTRGLIPDSLLAQLLIEAS